MKATKEWIERKLRPTPVLYCDLDGTIRHGKDELGWFVNKADDVKVFAGVPALLGRYALAGWRIVAISNQGGVALGLLTMEDCALAMLETQKQCQNLFDKIVFCTHHPDASDPEYAICWCRKPRIGLILESVHGLAAKYPEYYPPYLGLFIGDRQEDRDCAANAGLRFLLASEWRGLSEDDHDRIISGGAALSAPCVQPVGLTTCGYQIFDHKRADGSPMGHTFHSSLAKEASA